ncbi:MAG TPA: GSCFA domain-containing protein [Bradyrhizobium sp.]|nr:GSCFA domain-containing protein [Bradyrhizobium sp.]
MIPARQAFDTVKGKTISKWPERGESNRIEPECWPVVTPKFKIKPGTSIFTIGSCFARNIEEYLVKLDFRIPTLDFSVPKTEWPYRPNGILNKYTPPSVLYEIEWAARILRNGSVSDDDLVRPLIQLDTDGWVDVQLASNNPVTLARAKERRAELYRLFKECFDADVVTITLGLLECWWDSETQEYIQQAPSPYLLRKYPERFFYDVLDYPRCLDYMRKCIELMTSVGKPDKKIIVTTSPVPMARSFSGKDVIVANAYSKSVLRAVAGQVAEDYANVDYFPSYECVVLTRDNSIWANDLIHLSDAFIGKIVNHLVKNYVQPVQSE